MGPFPWLHGTLNITERDCVASSPSQNPSVPPRAQVRGSPPIPSLLGPGRSLLLGEKNLHYLLVRQATEAPFPSSCFTAQDATLHWR